MKAGKDEFGCEVVDSNGYRADLLIKAENLNTELLTGKKGNQFILDGCIATTSG